jgi:hypothetical protein
MLILWSNVVSVTQHTGGALFIWRSIRFTHHLIAVEAAFDHGLEATIFVAVSVVVMVVGECEIIGRRRRFLNVDEGGEGTRSAAR